MIEEVGRGGNILFLMRSSRRVGEQGLRGCNKVSRRVGRLSWLLVEHLWVSIMLYVLSVCSSNIITLCARRKVENQEGNCRFIRIFLRLLLFMEGAPVILTKQGSYQLEGAF